VTTDGPGRPGADGPDRLPRDIRVLIADDEALVRAGFKVLVDSAPGLRVVGEASDGVQAVRQARALKPDVVLMDLRMPVMGGLEATKVILDGDQDPLPRILVVTTFDEDEHVFEALRGGASGFVLKDTPPERLLDAIAIVAAGEALLAPGITRRLIAEFTRQPRPASRPADDALAQLTGRERDVLLQVASGKSNTEIAAALSLSVATVKTHISRLLDKLGCRDRAQLVVVAYETGVAIPGLRLPTIRSQALNIHTGNDQEAISLSGSLILAMHGEQSVSSVILGMVPAALCSQSGLEAPRARPARSGHPRAHEPRGALANP
jgi:DNA-binding NarL/FixJ family response regulator